MGSSLSREGQEGVGRDAERRMRGVFGALARQSESVGEHGRATLDKNAFLRFFSFLPGLLGERVFSIFDGNQSGAIDFEEFVQGMVRIYCGSIADKQKFLFDMYDIDGDGVVTSEEMATMLTTASVPPSLCLAETNKIPSSSYSFADFRKLLEKSPVVAALLNIFHHDTIQALFEAVSLVCPMCNASLVLRFCSGCGAKRPAAESTVCQTCDAPMLAQPLQFCLLCGHSLASPISPRLSTQTLGVDPSISDWLLLASSPVEQRMLAVSSGCCLQRRNIKRRATRVFCTVRESVPFLYVYVQEGGDLREVVFLRGCEFERLTDGSKPGIQLLRLEGKDSEGAVKTLIFESETRREEWLNLLTKAGTGRKLEDFYTVDWTREVGRGKFGQVFVGQRKIQSQGNEAVAVKAIARVKDRLDREFMRTEIAVGMLLLNQDCEHIVKMYDIFETSAKTFVVMEYMADGDLLNYLLSTPDKRLSNEEAALTFDCVLKALEFLHSRGITHRDMKVENCLVRLSAKQFPPRLEICKLMDFGLAALSAHGKCMSLSLGTVAYAAPEVILKQSYDRSVDLWGLGCLLYVILSGKLPFAGQNESEIASAVTSVKLHFRGDFWDPAAIHLIKHLLVRNPKHRLSLADAKLHPWLATFYTVSSASLAYKCCVCVLSTKQAVIMLGVSVSCQSSFVPFVLQVTLRLNHSPTARRDQRPRFLPRDEDLRSSAPLVATFSSAVSNESDWSSATRGKLATVANSNRTVGGTHGTIARHSVTTCTVGSVQDIATQDGATG